MIINIICSDPTWIYGKFVEEFKKYSANDILLNAKGGYDICHYIPYYELVKKQSCVTTIWASHQESAGKLKDQFMASANLASFVISHSKKYADILANAGIVNVKQIMPGIDFDKFKQRPVTKKVRNKLVVGYIGRQYTSTNRKNVALLNKIEKLSFVELRCTGGSVTKEKMPDFYADLDIICQTSLIEGGSMAVTEGLAVGVPIICYENVGVVNEFEHGVIKIPFNNESLFVSKLHEIWQSKIFLEWNDKLYMDKMFDQVKNFSWKNFALEHDMVWSSICA